MSYIGNIPLPQATEERIEVTATPSQTLFTGLTYVENYLDVYLNGVKLASSDFTATDGTTCTLAFGAASGDIVVFVSRTQTSALVALPLKDSSGTAILSESGSTVTLANVDTATIGSNALVVDSSGNVLVGYTSSNGSYKLQVNSQIFATSSTIATSDKRYKENIQPLDSGLAIVQALNPVQFEWREHPVHQFDRKQPTVGFIAQEVQEVLVDKAYKNSIIKSNTTVITPEELDEDGNVITAEVTEDFLGIAEENLVSILTKAIQEQQALIESQQSQINALTARIEALEATP